MSSANDLYKKIMQSLQHMNSQSPLKNFLQQQSLSLMRGIHISDTDKIKAMSILCNAATRIENQNSEVDLLKQLLLEINEDFGTLNDEYENNIEDSKHYIEALLFEQIDKTQLKEKYKGKPWLLYDKNSESHRESLGLKKPESNLPGSGLIPTKNGKGWEFPPLGSDSFTQQFAKDIAGDTKKHVLILGAGYGTFAYSLLENSKHNHSKFIINDLSTEHMAIFKDQLPAEYDGRTTVICGNFLDEIDFPENYFDHILLQNVMHFFTPEQVDNCLERLYTWLKPGSSLTITTVTPYRNSLKDYVSQFEQKKENNDEWAGFVPNLKEYLEQQNHPMASKVTNGPFHFFDESILVSKLENHHFQLARSGFFAVPKTFPESLHGDGKEYVGAEAYKPKM